MRELMVIAWKPAPAEAAGAIVRSPMTAGASTAWASVAVDAATAARLRQEPLADPFSFLRD
jgi:hypothetical protein